MNIAVNDLETSEELDLDSARELYGFIFIHFLTSVSKFDILKIKFASCIDEDERFQFVHRQTLFL